MVKWGHCRLVMCAPNSLEINCIVKGNHVSNICIYTE
jgi:hypothetical protein